MSVFRCQAGLVINSDTSMDAFRPKAPAGKEADWMQSIFGKRWLIALRLYDRLEPGRQGGRARSNSAEKRVQTHETQKNMAATDAASG